MSIWGTLLEFIAETASDAFTSVIEAVRTVFEGDPETRRRVAFSVAMIALSAKMAKADGIVSEREVEAFREIFEIPQAEVQNVARLFNLAKQDVAGFDAYAVRLANLCRSGEHGEMLLEDIIDGLFHIAKADGLVHEDEMGFLAKVAEIFGLSEQKFDEITARHIYDGNTDPYSVLGVSPEDDFATIKAHYRRKAAESHPDRLLARGVPEEFLAIANSRMAAINTAFEAIERDLKAA